MRAPPLLLSTILLLGAGPVRAATYAEHEPNNTRETANGPYAKGDFISASLSTGGDSDYYAFTAASGEGWSLDVTAGGFSISTTIYDATGAVVGTGGPGFLYSANFTAPSAGTYYARVTMTSPGNSGESYSIGFSSLAGIGDWSLY